MATARSAGKNSCIGGLGSNRPWAATLLLVSKRVWMQFPANLREQLSLCGVPARSMARSVPHNTPSPRDPATATL